MLKNILNLSEVQKLEKKTQAIIKGGIALECSRDRDCPSLYPYCSSGGYCHKTFRP